MNIKLAFGSPLGDDLRWMTKVLGCHIVNAPVSIRKFENFARSRSVLVRFV